MKRGAPRAAYKADARGTRHIGQRPTAWTRFSNLGAQALLQVAEELPRRLAGLSVEQLWARPGG